MALMLLSEQRLQKQKTLMDESATAEQKLTEFVATVFAEKGLVHFTDEMNNQAITDMVRLLRELIDRAVVEAMSEQKLDELNKMLEDQNATNDQVKDFINNSGVDIEKVTVHTMTHFRELYLQDLNGGEK